MPTAINHGTNNDQNVIVQVDYDKGGRMVAMRDPNGQETTYEYDQLGRRTKLTNPLNQEWTTSYAETANGTQTTMNYPEANHSVTRDFDLLGRLTGIQYGSQLTTPDVGFTYDAAGNRSQMTETGDLGSGATTIRETTYSYDNARRLTSVGFDEDGNGSVDETVAYDYDISGRRTSLTFDGQTIGYEYDERGRLITLTDWDNGRSTFSYDGAGRHIATQRPNGMRSSYRHDRAGRLARLQHHKGLSKLAQFDYTVDGRGNRTQVIEMLRPANANYATRTFAYNHADITYKGSWTDAGQFKATDDWADSLALTVTGDELTLTYGTGPDHSIFDIYVGGTFYNSYDGYAASTGEETVTIYLDSDQRISFEIKNRHEQNLASSGFRVRFKNLQAKSKLTTQVIDYTYDNLSRLIEADYGSDRSYAYQYDLAGNRTQQQTTIGMTTTTTNWTYDDANRMATMQIGSNPLTNFSYDANGNLTDDGILTYSYDRANRVSSVNNGTYNTHFAYDGNGDRYQQTVGGTISNYLLDTQPGLAVVLQETTGADTLNYIHSPMGVHAVEQTNDWHYMLHDGLGSVRGQVDDAAAVVASQMYDPYGQPFDVMGTFVGDFGYAGEQIDSNGLSYNRARTYNPSLGTFTSLDPFEGWIDEPMSLNEYSYVHGNPINLTDSRGMSPDCSECQQYADRQQAYAYADCLARCGENPCARTTVREWSNTARSYPICWSGLSAEEEWMQEWGQERLEPGEPVYPSWLNAAVMVLRPFAIRLGQAGAASAADGPIPLGEIVGAGLLCLGLWESAMSAYEARQQSEVVYFASSSQSSSSSSSRYGTCTAQQHAALKQMVEDNCKSSLPSSCHEDKIRRLKMELRQSGQKLKDVVIPIELIQERIQNSINCENARQTMHNTCYANVPNPDPDILQNHLNEIQNMQTARARCRQYIRDNY